MESFPSTPKSPEALLVDKYHLLSGRKASFEKVAMRTSSPVKVGAEMSGTLRGTVKVGEYIKFSDNDDQISTVKGIEERMGELFIHTETSTYRLCSETSLFGNDDVDLEDVAMIETGKGSTYRYLPDGTTQRFKKVENKEYKRQAALVYVPNWTWLKEHISSEELKKLGDDEHDYTSALLGYVHNNYVDEDRKVYIVNGTGKILETNKDIQDAKGGIYLALMTDGKTDFMIPVSHKPKLGFSTYDTRTYNDEKTGEAMRERHLGNAVVRIVSKKDTK